MDVVGLKVQIEGYSSSGEPNEPSIMLPYIYILSLYNPFKNLDYGSNGKNQEVGLWA